MDDAFDYLARSDSLPVTLGSSGAAPPPDAPVVQNSARFLQPDASVLQALHSMTDMPASTTLLWADDRPALEEQGETDSWDPLDATLVEGLVCSLSVNAVMLPFACLPSTCFSQVC